MESRLIEPSLNLYTKRDYVKKYWYIVILAIILPILSMILTSLFVKRPIFVFLIMFFGFSPSILIYIQYEILYSRHVKKIWMEHDRWENEPEIKKIRRDAYIQDEIFMAIGRVSHDIPLVFNYKNTKDVIILMDNNGIEHPLIIIKSNYDTLKGITSGEITELSIKDKEIVIFPIEYGNE